MHFIYIKFYSTFRLVSKILIVIIKSSYRTFFLLHLIQLVSSFRYRGADLAHIRSRSTTGARAFREQLSFRSVCSEV